MDICITFDYWRKRKHRMDHLAPPVVRSSSSSLTLKSFCSNAFRNSLYSKKRGTVVLFPIVSSRKYVSCCAIVDADVYHLVESFGSIDSFHVELLHGLPVSLHILDKKIQSTITRGIHVCTGFKCVSFAIYSAEVLDKKIQSNS